MQGCLASQRYKYTGIFINKKSTLVRYFFKFSTGEDEGSRTLDPQNHNLML